MGQFIRCNHRHALNHTRDCDAPVAEIVDGRLIIEAKHSGKRHRVALSLEEIARLMTEAESG